MAGILAEYFEKEIVSQLYKDNSFLSRLKNQNQHLNFKTIHIPQYSNNITVVKNASITLTKDAGLATETDFSYVIDDYSMDKPLVVQSIDELQTSYDKMSSVFSNTVKQFAEYIANEILAILIAQGESISTIVATTGSVGVDNGSDNTADKKVLVYADLLEAKKQMDLQDVSGDNRICLLDPVMYHELISDDNVLKFINYGQNPVVPTAQVPMLAGFELMTRSNVGESSAGNSRIAFCFVGNEVIVADEKPQVYISQKDTTWLGDAVRLRQAVGATNPRADGKNVILIKQAD